MYGLTRSSQSGADAAPRGASAKSSTATHTSIFSGRGEVMNGEDEEPTRALSGAAGSQQSQTTSFFFLLSTSEVQNIASAYVK